MIVELGLAPSDWVIIEGIQQAFPGAKGQSCNDPNWIRLELAHRTTARHSVPNPTSK